jgi:hypothetical protein
MSSSEYVYFQSKGNNVYLDLGGYLCDSSPVFENGKTSLDRYIVLNYNLYSKARFDSISSNLKVCEIHLPEPTDAYQVSVLTEIKELANERNCDIILHDEDMFFKISEDTEISVLGSENFSDKRMIAIDVEENRLRFLGNGFDYIVNSDVTVLMNGYYGDVSDINSDDIYASDSYIKKRDDVVDCVTAFQKRLVIEYNPAERDFVVYES